MVVIVIPVAEIEPEKAFRPAEPSFVVVTLAAVGSSSLVGPPVMKTLPPDVAKTPAESIPVVLIVTTAGDVVGRSVRVIVDPAPVA
jgi:hypothetical protein